MSILTDVAVTTTSADVNTGAILTYVLISALVSYVLVVIPLWAIFAKAGEPGWQALIPIWNTIVIIKIAGKPIWWIILLIIPIVNIIVWIVVLYGLSLSFGHGGGFTVGLVFLSLIFYYILAFDSSRYQGPAGAAAPLGYQPA